MICRYVAAESWNLLINKLSSLQFSAKTQNRFSDRNIGLLLNKIISLINKWQIGKFC